MILELRGVTKSFGRHTVLSNVSFGVDSGEILGFLGPNGAGKTTAIKIILGLLKADSGEVFINGHSIVSEHDKAMLRVGGIVESPDLYSYLSGYENLMQYARIYGISEERVTDAARIVRLADRINDKVSTYSLGMRQRLGVAQALLHDPNLLILDEPTNGLDPAGIKELRDILQECAGRGCAVMVSSHQLAEMELMCNSLCIIEQGRIITHQSMREFIASADTDEMHRYIFELSDAEGCIDAVRAKFPQANISSGKLELVIRKEDATEVCRTVMECGALIYSVTYEKRSLEDAFLRATADSFGMIR